MSRSGKPIRSQFGVGAHPILSISGDLDVHWGYVLDFDPWPSVDRRSAPGLSFCSFVVPLSIPSDSRQATIVPRVSMTLSWLSLGHILHFAYCGLVGNAHLTATNILFAPLPTSTKL